MRTDVVQGLEGFFDRRGVVPAVDLIEIDVIGSRAGAGCASISVMIALRDRPRPFGILALRVIDLGGDDHLVAAGQLVQCPAQDLFAGAVGIGVGGVEEVDPQLERPGDEGAALPLRRASRGAGRDRGCRSSCSPGRAAKPSGPTAAEIAIFHRGDPSWRGESPTGPARRGDSPDLLPRTASRTVPQARHGAVRHATDR